MTRGTIIRLVRTHGSAWGKIQPDGSSRDVFFNLSSLTQPGDFVGLEEGQKVEFEEKDDAVNGTHASGMASAEISPDTNLPGLFGR